MFWKWATQMVGWHKELGITKGLQGANTQNNMLTCSFGRIDLPIKLINVKYPWFRFNTIPVGPQSYELKRIGEQCLQGRSRI